MAEADRHFGFPKKCRIGYRATFFGENVSKDEAHIEPIDPERQALFEAMMWKLRPKGDPAPAE